MDNLLMCVCACVHACVHVCVLHAYSKKMVDIEVEESHMLHSGNSYLEKLTF